MRLYITVAVLTFLGGFAAVSVRQMMSAAHLIGGSRSGSTVSYGELFKTYNPLTLVQPDRLRALLSSNAGVPRMEPFRSGFSASDSLRAWRAPAIYSGAYQNRQLVAPPVYIPPPTRHYR
jgi:hypothetical protein